MRLQAYDFLWAAATVVILGLLAGCVTPPDRPVLSPSAGSKSVKTGPFWWGTSTASYQNEDRGVAKGSPYYFETDWDEYAREGHAPPRGDDATFSWTHFDKDLAALKKLGVNHYRFGVEWARVEPKPGVINEKALAQYVSMARRLKAAGIEPVITLWHFTFPDWLYDPNDKAKSNFLHPDVQDAWRAHVRRTVRVLKPYARVYVPQNEPNGALQLGYIANHWPPGLFLRSGAYKEAMDVSAQMFRDAAAIIKEERSDALVMGIYSLPHWRTRGLLDPTRLVYNIVQRQNYDHLNKVYDVCDLIGVNYYYSQDATLIRFLNRGHGEMGSNYTQNGWEIVPEGLYEILVEVYNRYRKPIVISENGLGTQSEQKKIRYLREHITQMRRAMSDGVDVRGYFPWTLIDNYEWKEGWHANFGLTHIDPTAMQLVMEPSGVWFSRYIKAHPQP